MIVVLVVVIAVVLISFVVFDLINDGDITFVNVAVFAVLFYLEVFAAIYDCRYYIIQNIIDIVEGREKVLLANSPV